MDATPPRRITPPRDRSGRNAAGAGEGHERRPPVPRPQADEEPCVDAVTMPFVWSLDRASNVGRALLAASRRLTESGSESPQLDAAVLMAFVLGVNKAWLYAHPTRRLTGPEIDRFEGLVRRRMCQEPVAYLVGFKPFFGLDITVDPRVLIPRPETELLVEHALAIIGHLIRDGQHPRVADVGTGSGAIAVALAINAPECTVYATDISEGALEVAAQNVWRYGIGDQVQLLPGPLLDPVPPGMDLIVANLPYVATSALAELPRQVREFEPMLALDGGPDGLCAIASFLEALRSPEGRARLRTGGTVLLEIGADQGRAAKGLVQSILPAAETEVVHDYAGLDRVLILKV